MQAREILCTVGPSSLNEKFLQRAEGLGVTLLRINLSHTSLEKLPGVIEYIQKHSRLPVCLDSEGAQVRTGGLVNEHILVKENDLLKVARQRVPGRDNCLNFYPLSIVEELRVGDFITIDFNSVLAQVVEKNGEGATLKIIVGGKIGRNKAVTVERDIKLSAFTEKDLKAIEIGKNYGIRHVALSFAHRKEDVIELRERFGVPVTVISKIECRSGVKNLADIARASDALLIDRGDLSREVPIEKIPLIQKSIIKQGKEVGCKVYVATNLLESMVQASHPTRAEVNDIYNTILDGADGLVLAAETAIGAYAEKTVMMLSKVIHEYQRVIQAKGPIEVLDYFRPSLSFLIPPHGGKLVDQMGGESILREMDSLKELIVDEQIVLDCEQIAQGVYSPLTGFMGKEDLEGVLYRHQLGNGTVWTMPIIFPVRKEEVQKFALGDRVLLKTNEGLAHSLLHIREIFTMDKEKMAKAWFLTTSMDHPGVRSFMQKGDWFLAGEVTLIQRRPSALQQYQYTPAQSRLIFEQKGWTKVVGFHTRNVSHRAHETIQLKALQDLKADGLYITPVIGPKKKGDFLPGPILQGYQLLIDFNYYPEGQVLLGSFSSYPRYCGPREAVFTALCRKNMGCSHFIIGRDHTGVGNFYGPHENMEIFQRLNGIEIEPVFFDEYAYHKKEGQYLPFKQGSNDFIQISGTALREKILKGEEIPSWFMRDIVQEMLQNYLNFKQEIFHS